MNPNDDTTTPEREVTTVQLGDWLIDLDSPERLYIKHKDHPGDISIKADTEGYVVDIYPDEGFECDATTYAFYEDLKAPTDEKEP